MRLTDSGWVAFENRTYQVVNIHATLGYLFDTLTSRLGVRADNDGGDEGYGNGAATHDLEQSAVRQTLASGDGLRTG